MARWKDCAAEEPIPDGHPSEDTTGRYPVDSELRRAGFAIEYRPKVGESIWGRSGKLYRESEALALIRGLAAK